ncbi:hypothetical protein GYA37_00570 [candidate division WWE3 bacterium]|uniref:Uncharacterized protein n=1 Tax=candidate division WWE3 bacterium TaxID=2053526 RepID=A0A7X9HS59_UNCKA|nr:hypothetical protein [candidate division WWE3 bacterium]
MGKTTKIKILSQSITEEIGNIDESLLKIKRNILSLTNSNTKVEFYILSSESALEEIIRKLNQWGKTNLKKFSDLSQQEQKELKDLLENFIELDVEAE